MEILLKNEEDIRNFVIGCTFYSTGGGGDPHEGQLFLNERLKSGKPFIIKKIGDVDDDEWICCAYYVGSIAPISLEQQRKLQSLGLGKLKFEAFNIAFYEMEKLLNIRISALIATELGGLNSSTSLGLAADIGVPIVDGDFAGRAIPESTQSLTSIYDVPVRPAVFCDSGGNVSIIKEAKTWSMFERIGKMISVAGGGLTATVGKLVKGKELKSVAIPGTITRCYDTGKKILQTKADIDPLAFARSLGGWWLFQGEVCDKKWEDREGYMYGEFTIKGEGEDHGHQLRVWYKNENHISWYDGDIFVTSPDLIVIVKQKTLEPLTNTNIKKGDSVWVFGFTCHERYRIPKAIELLGPTHFGFDYPYVPIERIVESKKCLGSKY